VRQAEPNSKLQRVQPCLLIACLLFDPEGGSGGSSKMSVDFWIVVQCYYPDITCYLVKLERILTMVHGVRL
jgi:hypothetical protein